VIEFYFPGKMKVAQFDGVLGVLRMS